MLLGCVGRRPDHGDTPQSHISLSRLAAVQFGLQVQVGDDVSAVKEDVVAVKEGMMVSSPDHNELSA